MTTITTVPDVPNNYDATNNKKIMIHDLSQPEGTQTKKIDAGALPYHRKDQTIQHKDHIEVSNATNNGFIRWFNTLALSDALSDALLIELLNLFFVDSKQGRFSQSLEIGNGGAPQGKIDFWGANAEAYTSLKSQPDLEALNTTLLPKFNCNLGEREELYIYNNEEGDILIPNNVRTVLIRNLENVRTIPLPIEYVYEGKKIDIIHISNGGEIPNYSPSIQSLDGREITTVSRNTIHNLMYVEGSWKFIKEFAI